MLSNFKFHFVSAGEEGEETEEVLLVLFLQREREGARRVAPAGQVRTERSFNSFNQTSLGKFFWEIFAFRRKSGKFFVRLKDKSAEGLLSSPKITQKAIKASSSSLSSPAASYSAVVHKCNFCEENFEKVSNLKNHVVNHFKKEMLAELPPCKPFACPCCPQISRDKITLLRHYAFTHRKIYEYCKVRRSGCEP